MSVFGLGLLSSVFDNIPLTALALECTNPVLIDEEDGIIAGNGRVLAAHVLGLDEVPCIVLAHLTPAQRRAYVVADNKLALAMRR